MTHISVELNTLEDFKKGQLPFSGFAEKIKAAGMNMGEVCSIGVLESGTQAGLPSISLLIKVKYKNKGKEEFFYCVAETTGAAFVAASKIAELHVKNLNDKKQKLDEMT